MAAGFATRRCRVLGPIADDPVTIEIRIDPRLCMRAQECIVSLPAVFRKDARGGTTAVPPDSRISKETLLDVAARCPNFAIQIFEDGISLE